MTKEQILDAIKEMSVLELNDLVKAIEEEFGVTAAAPVAVVGGAAAGAAEEKTEFDVVLASAGESKIKVIKVVRSKQIDLKPMDLEEAILQMDLLGHDFFIYIDVEDESTNVIYRREDGDIGLLEAKES